MTAISSNGTGGGNWGATTTWTGGVVPVDGDDVTIAETDEVLFVNTDDSASIDQSGYTSGISYVINGTLRFSTAANRTAYLKHKSTANLSGTGWLYVGNSTSDIIPRSSTATIYLTAGDFGINVTHARMYGYYFADRQFTTLSAGYAIGSTELVLDEDLGLQADDVVAISTGNWNGGITDANAIYTVQAYNAGTKTVTLTAGLAGYDRLQGDYVAIINRNILIDRIQYQNNYLMTTADVILYGVRFGTGIAIARMYSGGSTTYSPLLAYCTGYRTSAYVGMGVQNEGMFKHCIFFGSSQWAVNVNNTGTAYRCLLMNCGRGTGSGGWFIRCVVVNCSNFLLANDNQIHAGECVFRNNGVDITTSYPNESRFYNNYYSSTINNTGLGDNSKNPYYSLELIGINGVSNAYRCYTKGGYGLTQSSVQYNSTDTLQFVCQSTTRPVFRDYYLYLRGGVQFTATVQCQKSFSGADACGLMLVDGVIDALIPPLLSEGLSVLTQDVKTDDIDTWEELAVSYTPAANRLVILRVWAKAESGNVYFYTKDIEEMLPASGSITKHRATYIL